MFECKRLVQQRYAVGKWTTECGPNIMKKIEKSRKFCARWEVLSNGGNDYEVYRFNMVTMCKDSFSVSLSQHKCSCEFWDLSGVPCQHAMAVIIADGLNPCDYLSSWYSIEKYLSAYKYNINPVKGREFWPKSNEDVVHPPVVTKRMPGRPKRKRRREATEGAKKRKTVGRAGRKMRCKVCGTEGHNKTSCPKRVMVRDIALNLTLF